MQLFCRRAGFQIQAFGLLKKKNLNLYQRVVQMFAEAKRADHEAEGNIIRVQNGALLLNREES